MDADYSLPDVAIQPNKPPGFYGYNYPFWKFRMETYIKSSDIRLWDVIERGNNVPLDDEGLAKQRSRYTNEDYALVQLNYRAMHYIQCALSPKEFHRISHHKTAKDMWEALEAAHSGTKGVKARRVEMLAEYFHKFAMLSPGSLILSITWPPWAKIFLKENKSARS